jgi:tetratricopeptide (TPR) repeat protein
LLDEALEAVGPADSAVRVELLAHLAVELYYTPDAERRRKTAQEARAVAGRLNDPATELTALHCGSWALLGPDIAMDERLATAADILRRAERLGDRTAIYQAHFLRQMALLESGDFSAADLEVDAAERTAHDLRIPGLIPWVTAYRAMRAWVTGDFETGDKLANQALEQALRLEADPEPALTIIGSQLMAQREFRGGLEEILPTLRALADTNPEQPAFAVFVANIYADLGWKQETKEALDRATGPDFSKVPRDANWLICMRAIATSCAFIGDTRRAAIVYAMLEPFSDRWVSTALSFCFGPVSALLGTLATVLARYDDAERHFQHALAETARVGARPFLTYTQREYGVMLLARSEGDDLARARVVLSEGLTSSNELGMHMLGAKIRSDLERLGS